MVKTERRLPVGAGEGQTQQEFHIERCLTTWIGIVFSYESLEIFVVSFILVLGFLTSKFIPRLEWEANRSRVLSDSKVDIG